MSDNQKRAEDRERGREGEIERERWSELVADTVMPLGSPRPRDM